MPIFMFFLPFILGLTVYRMYIENIWLRKVCKMKKKYIAKHNTGNAVMQLFFWNMKYDVDMIPYRAVSAACTVAGCRKKRSLLLLFPLPCDLRSIRAVCFAARQGEIHCRSAQKAHARKHEVKPHQKSQAHVDLRFWHSLYLHWRYRHFTVIVSSDSSKNEL